jgi:hypothetical protein
MHGFRWRRRELCVFMFASEQEQVARRELMAANRGLDAAIRGRDWSAGALREAGRQISRDAVIGLYGRVLLHHDRVVTPSGVFELCREVKASVETARVIASTDRADAAGTRAGPRSLFLVIESPAGRHLEPCKAADIVKARAFASRVESAAATRAFEVDPETRLLDLASRYGELDGSGSRVRIALAEVRALEARLRDEDGGLPRRYRLRADPEPLPEFAS